MPYPMGVHEALEAWQQGEITYRRAMRLLGVDTIDDLYTAALSSGVSIRRGALSSEIELSNRAIALIDRQLAKVVDVAVAAPGHSP
jgi:hypothetical protein